MFLKFAALNVNMLTPTHLQYLRDRKAKNRERVLSGEEDICHHFLLYYPVIGKHM